MNRLAFFVCGLLLFSARIASADCTDPFGKPGEVLDFHLKMSRADWDKLRTFALDPKDCVGTYPNYMAEFRCGTTEPWIKVAIHRKRGSDSPPQKPNLKIDFNDDFMGMVPEAKGQSWPKAMGAKGYRKISLGNGQANTPILPYGPFLLPTLLTEHVGLRLLQREIPISPATAYAKVDIQFDDKPAPEYHGVYLVVEDIDRAAFRRRVDPSFAVGRLTKQTIAVCYDQVQYEDSPQNPALDAFNNWLKQKPSEFPGTWMTETEKAMDLDWLLRQEAIKEIIVGGDDTILNNKNNNDLLMPVLTPGLANNYYAFDPQMGSPRLFIPWDVDGSFGHAYDLCGAMHYKCAPTMPLLAQCKTPVDPLQTIMGQNTVCQPQIKQRYLETMCDLVNGSMAADQILKVFDSADAALRPVIPLEKTPIWGGRDPLDPKLDNSYGEKYTRLRAWIPLRIASVRQQLKASNIACPDKCTTGATQPCHLFACKGQRRCDNGAWTGCDLPSACLNPAAPVQPNQDGGADAVSVGTPKADGGAGASTLDTRPGTGTPVAADADTKQPTSPDAARATGGTAGTTGTTPGETDPEPDPSTTSGRRASGGCQVASHNGATGSGTFLLLSFALLVRRRFRDRARQAR